MNQLLQRLNVELHGEADRGKRIELQALIAANFARLGRFDEASKAVADARGSFPLGVAGVETIWIMLAEGLIFLFRDQSPKALDRVTRAQVLAIAFSHSRLISLTSAWKAHIEFENSNFGAMSDSLEIAVASANEDDHDSNARLSLVLSNAFTLCGQGDKARKWFLLAHKHAIKNGDQVSIDALIYNKAALQLANARVVNCFTSLDADFINRLRTEILSSVNFTSLTSVKTLANHLDLVQARLLMLEGKFQAAIEKLGLIKGQGPFAESQFSSNYVDLELAFCHFKVGNVKELNIFINGGVEVIIDRLDLDEQIVGTWMQRCMALVDSRFGDVNAISEKLEALRHRYQQMTSELVARLKCFS